MKKILSKLTDEQKYFSFLQFIFWALFGLSILSIPLITFCSEDIKLQPDFSYQGFENFLKFYNFSIKAFAGSIAIYAIIITFKRIKQTNTQIELSQKQLEIVSEQNRISNYFKYRDEFVKHFEAGEFHKLYLKYIDDKPKLNEIYYPLFQYFFGTIKNFKVKMKESVEKEIIAYTKELIKIPPISRIKNDNLKEKTKTYIDFFICNEIIANEITLPHIYEITSNYMMKEASSLHILKEFSEIQIFPLIDAYFNHYLLADLKSFSGIEIENTYHVLYSLNWILNEYFCPLPDSSKNSKE